MRTFRTSAMVAVVVLASGGLRPPLAGAAEKPNILFCFADDWGRHPSSCQHLIKRLMDRYLVTWVNTIGTRTPRFDLATIRRGVGKVKQW